MKRIASILAVAAAVIAFNACERQEVEELKTIDHLTFNSAKPEIEDVVDTKTGWNGSSVQWLAGDKIRVGFTLNEKWQSSGKTLSSGPDTTPRFYASDPLESDATNASFSLPIGESSFQEDFVNDLEGNIVFYGIYPSDACSPGQADAPSIVISIPAEQKPSASSFDASADILVGCSETLSEITADPVLMSWNRVVALADITLKELNIPEGENLLRLTLTAQEGANLVGNYTVNVTDGTVSGNGENEISLNVSSLEITSDNTLEVWAGFLPETVTSLKVVLTTDAATYTKEITGLSLAFKKNKRNILGIKMGDAVREGKEVNKYALLQTSNVVLKTGTNASEATVNGFDAVKVGTSGKVGTMSVVVPKGSTMLHIHAAGWKGTSASVITISGATTDPTSITLNNDDGISNNSPFTLSGSVDDQYYAISLANIESNTEISFTANSSEKRFVIWGVNVEPEPKEITWTLSGIEVTTDPSKTTYIVGQFFDPNGMVVTANYVDSEDPSNTKTVTIPNEELTYSPSLDTELAITDDKVTITYEGKTADISITVTEPSSGPVTDILNRALTGITGTSYAEWNGKKSNSTAVYAGQSAGGYESIQLRSSNSNSGVVTTASGGKVTKIVVSWNTNTTDGRVLNIYGKNSAYSSATDLYSEDLQGTLLGTIVKGESTELEITGDYTFLGFRSASGAMYLGEVKVTWVK